MRTEPVDTAQTSSSNQCHESFTMILPDEGVVSSLLGPLSHMKGVSRALTLECELCTTQGP